MLGILCFEIAVLLHAYMGFLIRHIYHKVNSAVDWVISFVADYFVHILWKDPEDFSISF